MKKNHEISGDRSATWQIRLAATVLVTVVVTLLFEGLAWGVYSQREYVLNTLRDIGGIGGVGQLHLDSYEIMDPKKSGHWVLRPNFIASNEALIAEKNDAGKWLGAAAVQEILEVKRSDTLRINSSGFKGPELDVSHRCPRILMIGDSATFGVGALSYPGFARTAFLKSNVQAEIINAGVEGYNPKNVLNEMPRYLALKPEIVTIYIGWNEIFATDIDVIGAAVPLKSLWLIRHALNAVNGLMDKDASSATHAYQKKLHINTNSQVLKKIRNHNFQWLNDIREIITGFHAIDTEVYLVTLLGLFQSDQLPSKDELVIGHLPVGTDNPLVLAALTDQANDFLRSEALRDGVHLIDLQKWGKSKLQPPASYFFDSVHFNRQGLEEVGNYIASELAKPVLARNIGCNLKG